MARALVATLLLIACLSLAAAQGSNSTRNSTRDGLARPTPKTKPVPKPAPRRNTTGNFFFRVDMNGREDKVRTAASGIIQAFANQTDETVSGRMWVKNIRDVTQAHFHIGARGVIGPVVAWLWPTDTKNVTKQPFTVGNDWWSVRFDITEGDLIFNSTLNITTWRGFTDAIRRGRIYANVHTVRNPAGEIRGQTRVVPRF